MQLNLTYFFAASVCHPFKNFLTGEIFQGAQKCLEERKEVQFRFD